MCVFCMFYVIYQSFFEDIDLNFVQHIHHAFPGNILYVFLKILMLRETFSGKNEYFLDFVSEFSKF